MTDKSGQPYDGPEGIFTDMNAEDAGNTFNVWIEMEQEVNEDKEYVDIPIMDFAASASFGTFEEAKQFAQQLHDVAAVMQGNPKAIPAMLAATEMLEALKVTIPALHRDAPGASPLVRAAKTAVHAAIAKAEGRQS